jgi:V/A-type H+/Na+-transporting ATPase subunit D
MEVTVDRVIATRSALLDRRAQLDLAVRGRTLLEQKRDQLMDAFRRIADDVLAGQGALERAAVAARRALVFAEAADGPLEVRTAASADRSEITLDARVSTIMGVRMVEIVAPPVGRPATRRGYSMAGSSAAIDTAAGCFETELQLLLELASTELRLRRLVEEIAATTRRVNALEFVVIPRLQRETASIEAVLDERERQDRFRLKRVKERHDRERRR